MFNDESFEEEEEVVQNSSPTNFSSAIAVKMRGQHCQLNEVLSKISSNGIDSSNGSLSSGEETIDDLQL